MVEAVDESGTRLKQRDWSIAEEQRDWSIPDEFKLEAADDDVAISEIEGRKPTGEVRIDVGMFGSKNCASDEAVAAAVESIAVREAEEEGEIKAEEEEELNSSLVKRLRGTAFSSDPSPFSDLARICGSTATLTLSASLKAFSKTRSTNPSKFSVLRNPLYGGMRMSWYLQNGG